MEESIKILEKMCNEIIEKDDCNLFETLSPLEIALKVDNLIKGYRDLEERNKQCIKVGDLERAVDFLMNRNDF